MRVDAANLCIRMGFRVSGPHTHTHTHTQTQTQTQTHTHTHRGLVLFTRRRQIANATNHRIQMGVLGGGWGVRRAMPTDANVSSVSCDLGEFS